MKFYDHLSPAELAVCTLDLALIGRDLHLGPTARTSLTNFAREIVADQGFDAAYHALGALLDRPEARTMLVEHNTRYGDATMVQSETRTIGSETVTALMSRAVAGDGDARAELDRRCGVIR